MSIYKFILTLCIATASSLIPGSGVSAQQLSLPRPLTSLLVEGAFVETGGFRFSGFQLTTPPLSGPTDLNMLQSIVIRGGDVPGYAGLAFSFGAAGITSIQQDRTLTMWFDITPIAGVVSEARIDFNAKANGLASAYAGAMVLDVTEDVITHHEPLQFKSDFGAYESNIPCVAKSFPHSVGQSVTKGRVRLTISVNSFDASSATINGLVLRFANGEDKLMGDYNLDGIVDGHDFLLWQRNLGYTDNVVADGNRSGSVDAHDLAIWRNNFGTQINPPGDFDGNGKVDGSDFLKWQRALGTNDATVDANKNGVVDRTDLSIWRDNFGTSQFSSIPIAISVPEPTSRWMLILTGITALAIFVKSYR